MKVKITRGTSWGCVDYVLGKEGKEVIGGTLAHQPLKEIKKQLSLVRRLRPDIRKPVWHASLSLVRGEILSNEQWENIATAFLLRMRINPETTQWLAVKHTDTSHEHIHLILNRIQLDGKVWIGRYDVIRAISVTQALERTYGLKVTKGYNYDEARKQRKENQEHQPMRRTREASIKERVMSAINDALKDESVTTLNELKKQLLESGIKMKIHTHSQTHVAYGITYSMGRHTFKASKLGKDYMLKQIEETLAAKIAKTKNTEENKRNETDKPVHDRTR